MVILYSNNMTALQGEKWRRISVLDRSSIDIPICEQTVIDSLLSDLTKNQDIEAIYLYGSYVRSEQKPYSDIDIAVVTRSSHPSRPLREHIGSYGSKILDIQVFSDLPLPAQMQVITQGVPLYIGNPEFVRELIRSITLTYMDLEPMRNRWRRRLLGGTNAVF